MAKLTSRKRKRLHSSSFAIPSKRKYPIDTANRARNALSRVAQYGSSAEKSQVRKAVHRKYPSIQVSGLTTKRKRRKK